MNRINLHLIGTFTLQEIKELKKALSNIKGYIYIGEEFDFVEQKTIIMFNNYGDKKENEK